MGTGDACPRSSGDREAIGTVVILSFTGPAVIRRTGGRTPVKYICALSFYTDPLECLFEISDNIIYMLNPDRYADQVILYPA